MQNESGEVLCDGCEAPLGPDYDPQMCCSGIDCGCMALPTNPPVCSKECFDKAYRSEQVEELRND